MNILRFGVVAIPSQMPPALDSTESHSSDENAKSGLPSDISKTQGSDILPHQRIQALNEAQGAVNNLLHQGPQLTESFHAAAKTLGDMQKLAQAASSTELSPQKRAALDSEFQRLAQENQALMQETYAQVAGQAPAPHATPSPNGQSSDRWIQDVQNTAIDFDGLSDLSLANPATSIRAAQYLDHSMAALNAVVPTQNGSLEAAQVAVDQWVEDIKTFSNFAPGAATMEDAQAKAEINSAYIAEFAAEALFAHDDLDAERVRRLVF